MKRKFQHKAEFSPLMGNMGEEEIDGPAGDQYSPECSPSSSSDSRDQQDMESRTHRLISPTRADFIDGTPPVHIRQQSYIDRQAELEGERERLLEKGNKSSPNSVDRWLKLLRDRDKLLRLSFCKENASILEGQLQRLERVCKSVERLALCPDPLVEQFCTTIGDLIKLCPLVLAHVRNPSLHDHMERGQSPLQPSAPSPQHSWVENERSMSDEFSKGKISQSNDETVGSPTCTPPKYSSTQNIGEALDAFKVGTAIWSPLTPDNSNNTNQLHIQSAENSLIGSYFALPQPNTSPQECLTPGSMLSVSNPFINRQVTLATQTSPMLVSIESGGLPDLPVYKPINLNNTHDSSINNINNSSTYTDSDFPTLSRKKTYASKTKTRSNTDSFNSVFDNPSVNCMTLQTSPLLKFANTKDMTVFKENYTPVLKVEDLKKTKRWCKVKNRRKKKKKTATEDMSGEDNTPGKDIQSPPKRARINFEYDDEKVTQALVAAIQNLGQPSRYVLLEHLEPTMV